MKFLRSIISMCRTARNRGLWRGLDVFCNKYQLAEHIKVLLEEEPMDVLHTAVQQQAMLALGHLSYVKSVLDGRKKSILLTCFNSIFLLPTHEHLEGLSRICYLETLDAMDEMLELFITNSPVSGFSELQDILQILLPFANSHSETICERAVGRAVKLTRWLTTSFSPEDHSADGGATNGCTESNLPLLGQLVGWLLLCHTCKNWQLRWEALDALHYLFRFIQTNRRTAPEASQQPQEKAEAIPWLPSPTTTDIATNFGNYLQQSERTDIILMVIEALRDSNIYNKQEASSVLDMAIQDPASWLTDVPEIVRCIYRQVECITTAPARSSLDILILWMANQRPREVASTLLQISPSSDSAALAMWETMFSQHQTMENVLRETFGVLQERDLRRLPGFIADDNCIPHLALLAHPDVGEDDSGALRHLQRLLNNPNQVIYSLVLSALLPASGTPVTARKLPVLLPGIIRGLQVARADSKRKALLLIGNVMDHVKRKQASSIALQVAGDILPLFNDECSQLQELSICLYNKMMQAALWCHKRQLKEVVRRGLLPLFFHLSDQTQSVAEASLDALVTAANFLKKEKLKHVVQTEQTWRIAECLLVQDKRKVEKYLQQSLPYLQHTQVALREAAVRFIGLAAQHCKDQSERKIQEICSFLQPLQNDEEERVVSLVTQTIFILTRPREQLTSSWCRQALCCCLS